MKKLRVINLPGGTLPELNEHFRDLLRRRCEIRGYRPEVQRWLEEFFQWWDLALDNGLNEHYFMAVYKDSEASVQVHVNDLPTTVVFDSHWSHLTGEWDLLIFANPFRTKAEPITITSREWNEPRNSPCRVFASIMACMANVAMSVG